MSDTSDDKGNDSQAEPTSKPEPPQSTDNSKKSTDSETKPSSQAFEEKQKGNEAYKKKDFTTAHLHYDKAIELDPTEISFRNNKAALYFEQKDYDKCIEGSAKAITIGREHRADSTLIAKALARAGIAYFKKEDDDNALRYLHKSLSEHRTTETEKLCYEVDKRMKEKERHAYLDPEKNLEAKTLGNEHFKKGRKIYIEAEKANFQTEYQYAMTAQQEICEKLEEEASDHERSILLVEIMNAMGFSKGEREIRRYGMHLINVLIKMFSSTDKAIKTIAGSYLEGMCGGMYGKRNHSDIDHLIKAGNIKLYTLPTNNIDILPRIMLNHNEDYDKSFFVNEDDNFPGYVKLSLVEVSDYSHFNPFAIMKDGKQYFSSTMIMNAFGKCSIKSSEVLGRHVYSYPILERNGPANTLHNIDDRGISHTVDGVYCIDYDAWPNSANLFITRRKPNNWPSNSMLENIKSQGCEVVAVGHHDSKDSDIQWRISFPGERSLLFDLNDVQTLCYALIKLIVKENLNTSQREVVSSFHIKNVIFWCVELCSCQWTYSNYINCVNICLTKLIEMIKGRHIPHYIIESRNVFNSKMTEKMSAEIVDVLSKYDTTHVFRLHAFNIVFAVTHYNNALLKNAALASAIIYCFNASINNLLQYMTMSSSLLDPYIPHNGTQSILNYVKILQNLKEAKGMSIHYVKYLVKSTLGFLYYEQYRESNKADILLTSKRLIHQSLKLDSSCVILRAAIFFLSNMEYSKSVEICDTFLTFPPRYTMDSCHDHIKDVIFNVREQLLQEKRTEVNEIVMTEILPMFYTSVKLKPLPENYDITQHSLVCVFRNLTNILFHGLYMDVTFTTGEKWVVPDPIQYELLPLPHNADHEAPPFHGINLDPMFVCLQTKFLCYYSMGHVNGMDKMLTLMSGLLTDSTFTANISCVYLNMLVYCQIKAGHHRQSVKYLLQSLRIFPSKYNAASGYLKIVLQILNSLSI